VDSDHHEDRTLWQGGGCPGLQWAAGTHKSRMI
jgi:hypothetical protein